MQSLLILLGNKQARTFKVQHSDANPIQLCQLRALGKFKEYQKDQKAPKRFENNKKTGCKARDLKWASPFGTQMIKSIFVI